MSDYRRGALLGDFPPTGTATKWLCGLLVGVSVFGAFFGRRYGMGSELLVFSTEAVLRGELWRLLTYAFVKSQTLALMISTLVLFMFGRWYENSWGTRDYLRFFLVSTVGAAVLAIPLTFLLNAVMPFQDTGMAEGPDAAIDAMMVALALSAPNSRVMFGFVLPVPARAIFFLILGIDVIGGVMSGAANLSVTLGGMIMGYFLVTGNWRPKTLIDKLRTRRAQQARANRLYVVPPKDKRNLH